MNNPEKEAHDMSHVLVTGTSKRIGYARAPFRGLRRRAASRMAQGMTDEQWVQWGALNDDDETIVHMLGESLEQTYG